MQQLNWTQRLAWAGVAAALGAAVNTMAWTPARGPLQTRWTKSVTPENAWREYPRPQMIRADWLNLNGLWEYAIVPKTASRPERFDGQILVPFPVESALSGVMRRVAPDQRLWYRRTFTPPEDWRGRRVLLHFGAVDFETQVWLNGRLLGGHRGGYDAFSFDATEAIRWDGPNELVVAVWDPTDAGPYPRGKQVRKPGGIFYTPTTGIWQTVWLEPVAPAHIEKLKITPHLDESAVEVQVFATWPKGSGTVCVDVWEAGVRVAQAQLTAEGSRKGLIAPTVALRIPHAKPWSPDSPYLYDLTVRLLHNGAPADQVGSYFGLRKISLGKDENGFTRLCLNNKVLFQYGPLDQGFWPDGIYAAPCDEALRYDLEVMKRLGMNMARKHVKIEPQRWYAWCDRLGILVWQDMPSGRNNTPESRTEFERELEAMVRQHYNHPSIVMWVPFNEGWGQYDTERIVRRIKRLDPTRLVNNASGWTDKKAGDVHDAHRYPGPAAPPPEEKRAGVLGEFGGLGLPLKGHTWQAEKNWGYRSFSDREALTAAYLNLLRKLHPLVGTHGLSAAVYTQITDVEVEVNGLMTYDREVIKMDPVRAREAGLKLYGPPPPPPLIEPLAPTSEKTPQTWRYTFAKPGEDWTKPGFDDSAWKKGPGGFGTKGTPGAIVRTVWNGPEIWIRRRFTLPKNFPKDHLFLRIHHDEDAEVYVNGKRIGRFPGYVGDYDLYPAQKALEKALRPGENVLAAHCRQTGGGQYIDVGIVRVIERR